MQDHTTRQSPEVNIKLCECGCGLSAPIAKKTITSHGIKKGQPQRFIVGHNRRSHFVRRHSTTSPEDRFWEKVDKGKVDDCWLWQASVRHWGYGQFWDGEQLVVAHRYSYELHYGSLEDGLLVCHRCDNPGCVNPHHLFAGSQSDNIQDMMTKGRRYQPDVSGKKNGRYKDGRHMKSKESSS